MRIVVKVDPGQEQVFEHVVIEEPFRRAIAYLQEELKKLPPSQREAPRSAAEDRAEARADARADARDRK